MHLEINFEYFEAAGKHCIVLSLSNEISIGKLYWKRWVKNVGEHLQLKFRHFAAMSLQQRSNDKVTTYINVYPRLDTNSVTNVCQLRLKKLFTGPVTTLIQTWEGNYMFFYIT